MCRTCTFRPRNGSNAPPVLGGSVDVAGECRGLAAVGIALTRPGSPEAALARIIELLVDETPATRVRAAQALGLWRGPEAAPLLRLKALMGDEVGEVMGEVFLGMLRPGGAIPVITRHSSPAFWKTKTAASWKPPPWPWAKAIRPPPCPP